MDKLERQQLIRALSCTDEDWNEFNIDPFILRLMDSSVFFAALCRKFKRVPSRDVLTAAMVYDRRNDDFKLMYNPGYLRRLSKIEPIDVGVKKVQAVLVHEMYHFVFDHLGARYQQPSNWWNWATDGAVDTLIEEGDTYLVPEGLILPGRMNAWPGDGMSPEIVALIEQGLIEDPSQKIFLQQLDEMYAEWPKLMTSEWYMDDIRRHAKKNNWPERRKIRLVLKKGTMVDGQPLPGDAEVEFDMDVEQHEGWDVDDNTKEMISEKVRAMLDSAAKEADRSNSSRAWGSVSNATRLGIKRYISRQVDWRSIMRNFVGTLVRGERELSLKRINKKYPYIHPGPRRGYTAHVAVCMDMSGSVSDKTVELFFAWLGSLTQQTSITLIPFDHEVAKESIFEWKQGSRPPLERVRCGGTCFDCVTEYVNSPNNRGRWDGMIVLTDGAAPKPRRSRVKRCWVLEPGQKLIFENDPDDLVVEVQHDSILKPGWG